MGIDAVTQFEVTQVEVLRRNCQDDFSHLIVAMKLRYRSIRVSAFAE